jgi:hypothetical protein
VAAFVSIMNGLFLASIILAKQTLLKGCAPTTNQQILIQLP